MDKRNVHAQALAEMRGEHLAELHELREHKRAFTVLDNLIDELFQPCNLARAMLPMIKQP